MGEIHQNFSTHCYSNIVWTTGGAFVPLDHITCGEGGLCWHGGVNYRNLQGGLVDPIHWVDGALRKVKAPQKSKYVCKHKPKPPDRMDEHLDSITKIKAQ